MIRILQGDCREVMATLEANSVDAIVCDPPYELGFMGKGWDRSGVANDPETWRQALRVLKPGGHLLAFSGSRTYHRMVCAIEDAGFEIRDQIMWLYGSGFPKSLDVSKAIDKAAGAERTEGAREWSGGQRAGGISHGGAQSGTAARLIHDEPATEAARQWSGWGTALKPAHEPIVVARKPLVGTVAANVLQHGTGALNIDGCRVDGVKDTPASPRRAAQGAAYGDLSKDPATGTGWDKTVGRWPANVIHDGSDEVLAAFPDTRSGTLSPDMNVKPSTGWSGGSQANRVKSTFEANEGSAARFFYTAKASRYDRNDGLQGMPEKSLNRSSGEQSPGTFQSPNTNRKVANHHPTVKPTELMRWLCRLVTPPGGLVLDPFAGSGSTMKAAELEGFRAIGIELDPAYIEIAKRRIGSDAPLFAQVNA